MKKTFEEWVEIYEKKSGDKHICPEGYVTLYEPEKGYAIMENVRKAGDENDYYFAFAYLASMVELSAR